MVVIGVVVALHSNTQSDMRVLKSEFGNSSRSIGTLRAGIVAEVSEARGDMKVVRQRVEGLEKRISNVEQQVRLFARALSSTTSKVTNVSDPTDDINGTSSGISGQPASATIIEPVNDQPSVVMVPVDNKKQKKEFPDPIVP